MSCNDVPGKPKQDSEKQPNDPGAGQAANDPGAGPFPARRRRRVDGGRPRTVYVKLGHAEWTAAATGARDRGLALGAFAAKATLAAATGGPAPRRLGEREQALRECLREIGATRTEVVRVGTLLNQAIAALNSTGEMPPGLPYLAGRVAIVLARLDEQTARMLSRG